MAEKIMLNEDSKEFFARVMQEYPLLSKDEEIDLGKRKDAGDPEARKTLFLSNVKLVFHWTSRFSFLYCHSFTYDDAFQEGLIGLTKAVNKFDWKRGFKFSTYASRAIYRDITRGASGKGKTIRIPSRVVTLVWKYNTMQTKLLRSLGREPSLQELAAALNTTVSDILETQKDEQSFTQASGEMKAEDSNFLSTIRDDRQSGFQSLCDADWNVALKSAVNREFEMVFADWSERDQNIMRKRFGLTTGTPGTLQEVADEFGVTRERVRQIENVGIRLLSESEVLRKFFERMVHDKT